KGEGDRGDNRRDYNRRQNQRRANAGAMTNAVSNDNEVPRQERSDLFQLQQKGSPKERLPYMEKEWSGWK
ncbi:hypothetical protein Tco_0498164, partial [Tanacetum coccineum]